MAKFFYDTNALLRLKEKAFQEHFYISSITLEEIEAIKWNKNKDDGARHDAKRVAHLFDECEDMFDVLFYDEAVQTLIDGAHFAKVNSDIIICATAAKLRDSGVNDLIFVTDDSVCKSVARKIFRLTVKSVSEDEENIYKGYQLLKGNTAEINDHLFDPEYAKSFYENEYLLIYNTDTDSRSEMKFTHGAFDQLKLPPSRYVKAKNALQRCALDILNNNNIPVAAILGGYGSGKAQPDDTIIPTPAGYKKLGDIRVGDYVFDRLGKPTKVSGVYPKGEREVFQVTFSDGRTVLCNDEHLWSYYTSKGNLKTIELKEMINHGVMHGKKHNYAIPLASPAEYATAELDVNPYLMGYSIGNGCLKERSFTISCSDIEVIDKIKNIIGADDYYHCKNNYSYSFYKPNTDRGKGVRNKFLTAEIFKNYSDLCCAASEKYIPANYKYGSVKQRIELLRGLLDSDGSIDSKGRVSFSTTSTRLKDDVSEICYSLGFKCSCINDKRNKYTSGIAYELQIICPPNIKPLLFTVSRKKQLADKYAKKAELSAFTRKVDKIYITDIRDLKYTTPMTCIYVDNEEHLYLTNDYIVTHNTYLSMKTALYQVNEKGNQSKILGVREPYGEGKEVGYLPGSLEEKTDNFFLPLEQQLDGGRFELENLKQCGVLDSNVPYFMKGTSYENTIIIVDEAEDLSKKSLRLVGTRLGQNSRIFLAGDYKQAVVNASDSNPLIEMCNAFKGNPKFACIYLGEDVRSEASKMFADLFD